jgi:phosphoenolpyruvate-protein kinase (PTS system EI component)
VKSTWQRIINKNFKKKKLNDLLILPPLIFSKKDFDVIQYYLSKPNYITSKKISKKLLKITNSNQKSLNLKNKIVLIENADPGYDWIFTRNPSGLITKYGGVASHMAIRCSELGLPAAIGCGEILFDKLLNSKEIILDCQNMQIIFLKSNIDDEYFEEKRVLKSLGYIK